MAETAHSSTPIRLSPISSPSNSQRSLSEQINASSRSTHSQLNRSIIARLPMVLPPQTTEPSTYISGLLHIAPIYITFESLWASILETPYLPIMLGDSHASDACESESPLLAAQPAPTVLNTSNVLLNHLPKACSRTHALLAHLWLPGLLRSGRLRADIRSISGMSEHKFDEQVEEVSRSGKIAKVCWLRLRTSLSIFSCRGFPSHCNICRALQWAVEQCFYWRVIRYISLMNSIVYSTYATVCEG
jgi:hypothetical protein